VTGRTIEGVTTGEIYWGAVPFVIIQILMIGITIAFPQLVMHYRGAPAPDSSTIEIRLPPVGGAPGGTQNPGLQGPPSFGPPANLSQPPSFGAPATP
jgi:hypothetical protein